MTTILEQLRNRIMKRKKKTTETAPTGFYLQTETADGAILTKPIHIGKRIPLPKQPDDRVQLTIYASKSYAEVEGRRKNQSKVDAAIGLRGDDPPAFFANAWLIFAKGNDTNGNNQTGEPMGDPNLTAHALSYDNTIKGSSYKFNPSKTELRGKGVAVVYISRPK